jgi:nucleotide-binding universal stress UspA family protein
MADNATTDNAMTDNATTDNATTHNPSPASQFVDPALPPGRVVVGVDGSEGSLMALRWAVAEGRVRGTTVHAVLAWQFHPHWGDPGPGRSTMLPLTYGAGMPGMSGAAPTGSEGVDVPGGSHAGEPIPGGRVDTEAAVRNVLDVAVAKVSNDAHPVVITQEVVEGHAAVVLLDAVTESDLLVVGSRGHGEFAGALLGSISQHLVTHSACPVVVIPAPHRGRH